jgi:F-type H+-transporting ATPase subunit gamma
MYFDAEFDKCLIFYNKFKSVISQIPTEQQVVPAEIAEQKNEADSIEDNIFFEFEPNEKEILEELLPLNFAVQIFKALLESSASEQGSRMSAMDNASRNASDMIDSLTLFYNRSRQAVITKELIEIISGAEAV